MSIHFDELRNWGCENMPELSAELGPMPLPDCRARLNALTGLAVKGSDSRDGASVAYLEALKQIKAGQSARNPETSWPDLQS